MLLARDGARLEAWLPRLGLARVVMPIGRETSVAAALDAEPAMDFVTPDRNLAHIADVPLDEFWGQQWGPAKVQGPAAWDLAWSDPSITIAILDTGVLQDPLGSAGSHLVQPRRERARSGHRAAHL